MKSFAPIVIEKNAVSNNFCVAGTPIVAIISCLLFAKLSNCASKLILPICVFMCQIFVKRIKIT